MYFIYAMAMPAAVMVVEVVAEDQGSVFMQLTVLHLLAPDSCVYILMQCQLQLQYRIQQAEAEMVP